MLHLLLRACKSQAYINYLHKTILARHIPAHEHSHGLPLRWPHLALTLSRSQALSRFHPSKGESVAAPSLARSLACSLLALSITSLSLSGARALSSITAEMAETTFSTPFSSTACGVYSYAEERQRVSAREENGDKE